MIPQVPAEIVPPLGVYLELLDRWNSIHALTAVPTARRWDELIVDACALLPPLAGVEAGRRLVDLGTGMGIPAVVLALARPDLEVVGVDSSGKKIAFLRQAVLELGLPNLQATLGRFESLEPLAGDVGVAKALAPLPVLLGWWRRHGRPGAPFLALKGPGTQAEGSVPGWEVRGLPYEIPGRGPRTVLEARPAGGTP
ncbi:MAG: 16S rRNA (guanine(527)-N(7))-methyltransferase RsmG [Holophagaceae bacterium]